MCTQSLRIPCSPETYNLTTGPSCMDCLPALHIKCYTTRIPLQICDCVFHHRVVKSHKSCKQLQGRANLTLMQLNLEYGCQLGNSQGGRVAISMCIERCCERACSNSGLVASPFIDSRLIPPFFHRARSCLMNGSAHDLNIRSPLSLLAGTGSGFRSDRQSPFSVSDDFLSTLAALPFWSLYLCRNAFPVPPMRLVKVADQASTL